MQKLTMLIVVSLLIGHIFSPGDLHSGLFETTRTLLAVPDDFGFLNVFSEPPALEIRIDGKIIGKTPLLSIELSSGMHVLHIGGSEAKVFISARKAESLNWFKDSFIEIPEKTKSTGEPTAEPKKKEI